MVAGTIDDGFLLRVVFAVGQHPLKQMRAHGRDAIRQDGFLFQRGAFIALGNDGGTDRLAGEGVGQLLADQIGPKDTANALGLGLPVVIQIPLLNGGGGEVALADAL